MDADISALIDQRTLSGSGIGHGDAGRRASLILTPGATLWAKDKGAKDKGAKDKGAKDTRLHGLARAWGLAATPGTA
jgi:hypothetical protein